MLRDTAREEFKIFEATLLNLSPCAAQRYRGSAQRARGLNVQYKQTDMMAFSTPPSLRTPPLSHIRAQRRRSTTHFLAFVVFNATRQNILTSSLAVFRSMAGCFCNTKYRGGVRRTEGLKKKIKKYGYSAFTGKSKALINPI